VPRRLATAEFTIGNPAAAVWPRSASGLAERDSGGSQADVGGGGVVVLGAVWFMEGASIFS